MTGNRSLTGIARLARQRFTGTGTRSDNTRRAADRADKVEFTVNGRQASVHVAPRVTLADALRDHLGLTGTHVGCEHGVCGMCTVLIDGDAARSCLVLACQVEGSEVTTVEGLGTPAELHPLQEAFGRHHALQCGFCTPGQLVSAYDLLSERPGIPAEELPEQLSGVLCRCTGYRNIVSAVAEVAEAHPQGVPEPLNCGAGRLAPARLGGPGEPGALAADDDAPPAEVVVPGGDPTARIAVAETVAATPAEVWRVVEDTHRLAACLPGAEIVRDFGDDRYRGRVGLALGPVRLAFLGDVLVTERDQAAYTLAADAQGSDAANGQAVARLRLRLEPDPAGTRVSAEADLYLSGRIAQFGRGLVADVSRDLFARFAIALGAAARGEAPLEGQAAPADALAMARALLISRLRSLRGLGKKFRTHRRD
ncbi:2Fe-2S ferredoxin [Enemella evansiae]|uniref:xanthine dehydrogenase family Fe-S subunit n=1 Tax=Enemella evansiae TaxID=2016499 RepID=UPI000B9773B0|nr:2Fe-2S iron-sulfur cluster-binding protein [Enemella evansiae]OYO16487.1 2Fe-2S ferredoxin [Enemella evansiae]